MKNNKNIEIIGMPYVYENAFKTDKGEIINYCQLAVDVRVGDTTKRLVRPLRGFEPEYIKSLISADNAFGEGDE